MFKMKHDIQINLKNEKEVFRLIWLLLSTFVLSAALLGLPDYIWNMTLYRISVWVVPWLIAVPAIVNCAVRKIGWRELLGPHIAFQIIIGCLLGIGLGMVAYGVTYWLNDGEVAQLYGEDAWVFVRILLKYVLVVGATEELIYRVAIMGTIEDLLSRNRWIAPLAANILFALVHRMQNGWNNVVFALVVGAVYTVLYYKWKKCGYVMIVIVHGVYDFTVGFASYLLEKL